MASKFARAQVKSKQSARYFLVYHTDARCARIRLLMRRGASIFALTVLLIGIVAPVVLAAPAAVPACCRVGGSHHCEMSLKSSGLPGVQSVPETCPYRDHSAVTSELIALTAAAHRIAVVIAGTTPRLPAPVVLCDKQSRDAHKRGPPTRLAT